MRRLYRHLLRAAPAAVQHVRPAARSVRQLLRADVETVLQSPDTVSHHVTHAERSMVLLTLSALSHRPVHGPVSRGKVPWRPSSDSHAAVLVHRLIRNLVSLAYHHLSPNTQMQPLQRRAGGTSSDTSVKKPSVVSRALAHGDYASLENVSVQGGAKLAVLHVSPKPVRGPLSQRQVYWDGQHPEKHLRIGQEGKGSAELARLQLRLEALQHQSESLAAELGPKHKRSINARAAYVELRGTVKSIWRTEEQRHARATLAACPAELLDTVVQGAALSESLWIGAPRFAKWRRGEYLPP